MNKEKYKVDLSVSSSNDVRIKANRYLCDGINLLDVGCASGDFADLVSRTHAIEIHGMEYDVESLKVASSKGLFTRLARINLNDFNEDEFQEYKNYFDVITLLDVLEHTIDPAKSLGKIMKFLKRGGKIIVSVPNISHGSIKENLLNDKFEYTDTGILDDTHLRFFTGKTLAGFFAKMGLEIINRELKLEDVEFLPFSLGNYVVRKSPESYVYQYMVVLKQSDLLELELIIKNESVMAISWVNVRGELWKLRMMSLLGWLSARVLPGNKKIRMYVKQLLGI